MITGSLSNLAYENHSEERPMRFPPLPVPAASRWDRGGRTTANSQ